MKMAEVSMDAFVSELVDLARPQAQAVGVTISVDLGTVGATIAADSDLLKQAALNIVVNAIEAMPKGGELRFESSLEGEEAELRISDSGAGFSLASAKLATGLGLVSMQERLRLVGGHLSIESDSSHGTQIRVRIPRHAFDPHVHPQVDNSTLY